MPPKAPDSDVPEGGPSERVPTTDDLVAYFRGGAKPPSAFRVGVEQEKLATRATGAPVPYDGPNGIAALLAVLEGRGFTAQREDGHTIALERAGDRITLEPGGQFELSGAALPTAAECAAVVRAHVRELQAIAAGMDIHFLGIGGRPWGAVDEIGWLPKRRYGVMRTYFPAHGRQSRLAHYMMKQTATVQANFDYADEAEAVSKIRAASGVTSLVTALYAASPISEGRPNGFKTFRAAIWLETDEDRAGLLSCAFQPGFAFRDYVEWALDVPMFFVVRDGVYRPAEAMTFRRFLRDGFEGQTATMHDWEVHLSTLFPEVRLKRYIEVRGADATALPMAVGLAALWRGLLDEPDARAAAWALVDGHDFAAREALRRAVPREALGARLGRHSARDLTVELLRIARAGLVRLPGGEADAALLEPLEAYAADGRSPADDLLDEFASERGDPARLVTRWELKP
jgi:glutamate--cysteine ligase